MKFKFSLAVIAVFAGVYFLYQSQVYQATSFTSADYQEVDSTKANFELKCGDILIRPNWGWLPGSFYLPGGRKYGHVAVVTEGSSGSSMEEVLEKAKVVEALFFDQGTRKFQWKKADQIRERAPAVSFGNRFKGNRYRLRADLPADVPASLVKFLRSQLDGGYNILSLKRKLKKDPEQVYNWHCATLTWTAFFIETGLDIDANGGLLIYPNDILASEVFNGKDGRLKF